MKNINILAVAAALSAVMTGSAFAAATAGETLPITVALSSTAVTYATAVAHNVTIPENGIIPANTKLATISNLPAGATLVDTSADVGKIKFTSTSGGNSFQAVAKDSNEHVVSANTAGDVRSRYTEGEVTVKTDSVLKNAQPGVYVSTPVIYTYTE
ncbi:hypothetical protein PXU57_004474 [Salmonella enterica subsp. enterica]|nr:hypothetical protein [Salmonella enterica subsp. enterica]